jgi:hypothetical protein
MPARKSSKPKPRRTASKFLILPPGFCPVDATREEVASFRRESLTTVNEKCKDGRYESYLEGRIRKIILSSVLADRQRSIDASREPPETGKRRVGRPRKHPVAAGGGVSRHG